MRIISAALVACALACYGEPSATGILEHTAATYRSLKGYEAQVTEQTIRGGTVSERHFTQTAPAFTEIDRNIARAGVAREENLIVDGKPVPVWVVEVTYSTWPAGSLPGAQFAMYRIDKETFAVRKAIEYAPGTTRITLYSIAQSTSAKAPEDAPPPHQIVGNEAPDFTLEDIHGRKVALHDLRGKVVIVDFWATWCPPCRALMPHLDSMQKELGPKGLVILGLDIGEERETVSQFSTDHPCSFTLLLGAEPTVSAKYFVESYPTTFVIDRAGRIASREMGGGDPAKLRAAVDSALAK